MSSGGSAGERAGPGEDGERLCDSWEEIDRDAAPALEQLNLMSPRPQPTNRPINCKVEILTEDNPTLGTSYMMPEPAIRILKRPESLSNGQLNGEVRARPVKTLEQRQKDYEEARLRILGEARSPEDVSDENLSRLLQDKQPVSLVQPVKLKERPTTSTSQVLITVATRRTPPSALTNGSSNGILALRSPRGPDGTKGFTARR